MAIVKKYPASVVEISNYVNGVYALELKSLEKPFRYEPGQFLHLSVDEYDPAVQWPDSRCFSIQSNPLEKNIKITFAVKGRYTKKMEQTLKKGSIVWLKLPYGNLFTQPHNIENTAFIAGGTGITPFLSLFNDLSFAKYHNPVLYAGFKDNSMNFYYSEIERAKIINPTLFIDFVYENLTGFINLGNVLKMVGKESSFFISGPPLMISSFRADLIGNGVSSGQIFTDDWE